jgi:CHAT domain-containing protein
LADFAVSSYIPTVNTVLKSSEPNSIEKRGDVPTGLLIVSQPNTPKQTPIPYAADEAKRISRQLKNRSIPYNTLDDQNGTVKDVLKAMESFPSIHLACHASQNTTSPLKSSIYLHDGPLELSEIMKKNLPYSDFAFLSACQTSTADKNLPEEVVHLAAGMLTAGYRSVVGTLWSIVDKHGPDMAEFFYESLLDGAAKSNICGAGAAQALHSATQRFREENLNSRDGLLVWVPYIHVGV